MALVRVTRSTKNHRHMLSPSCPQSSAHTPHYCLTCLTSSAGVEPSWKRQVGSLFIRGGLHWDWEGREEGNGASWKDDGLKKDGRTYTVREILCCFRTQRVSITEISHSPPPPTRTMVCLSVIHKHVLWAQFYYLCLNPLPLLSQITSALSFFR